MQEKTVPCTFVRKEFETRSIFIYGGSQAAIYLCTLEFNHFVCICVDLLQATQFKKNTAMQVSGSCKPWFKL